MRTLSTRRFVGALAAAGIAGAMIVAQPAAVPPVGAAATTASAAVAVRSMTTSATLATFPTLSSGSTAIGHYDPVSVTEEGLYHRRLNPHPASPPLQPHVASTSIVGATGVAASHQGLDAFQERSANNGNQFTFVPPDQGLCAGNGFVLESVNDALRVYDASTMKPLTGVVDMNTFYGYRAIINRETGVFGPSPTDPSCVYDAEHHRFVQVVLTLETDKDTGDLTGRNHIDFAVSRTSDPRGGWNIYRLPVQDDGSQGTPKHKDCPCVGDYPHVGQDANGIYVTTNEYPFSDDPGVFGNNFNGAQLYAISKAALASGSNTVRVLHYQNLQAGHTPGFTVWPSQSLSGRYDTRHGGTEYFAETIAAEEALGTGSASRVVVWSLTNTASLNNAHPSAALNATFVNTEQYTTPPPSVQKSGPAPLGSCLQVARCGDNVIGFSDPSTVIPGAIDSLDGRMQQTWYDAGKLWTAFGTGMLVDGTTRAGVAYVAFDVSGSPSVAKQGYVGNARNNVLMPAIAIMPNGKGVISASFVGDTLDPSSGFVRVGANGTHGALELVAAGTAPLDDFCEYNAFDCAFNVNPPLARPRFGDYGAAVVSGNRIIIANENVASRPCTLGQWVNDGTCGETRAPLANWGTRLSSITP